MQQIQSRHLRFLSDSMPLVVPPSLRLHLHMVENELRQRRSPQQ